VVRFEDDDNRRRVRVEASPELGRIVRGRERVEQSYLPAGLDARRGYFPLPPDPGLPVGMIDTPDPETGRDVAELMCHARLG
jgi:hypothetical protein